MGSAVHHVLENFQRPHGLELSTFSPESTELGECYWESLQLVLNSDSVSVTQIARCYLSILFVETLGSLVTILLPLLLLRVYVLQRRAVRDIEFGFLWLPDSATICASLLQNVQLESPFLSKTSARFVCVNYLCFARLFLPAGLKEN